MRSLGITLLLCLTGFVALAPAQRKRKKSEKWRIDPYTKNDPKAMKRAGYVAFHPFEFGEHSGKAVSTEMIEQNIGKAKIRWVETQHFKIGSTLPSFTIPASDRKLKVKLRGELERLAKKLPRIKTNARKLDPWLRVHIFAQRCEDVYADFSKRLGVTDDSFPKKRNALLKNGKYWGEGIYLGQPEKFTLLMFEKTSDFMRYLSLFIGKTQEFAQRWNFKRTGSQLLATSMELESRLKHDTGMHCHVVWNVVHNMINGYRFYAYDLPVWFTEGMAHWYSRRVSKKYALDFDQNESSSANLIRFTNWKAKTRQWAAAGKFRPASELLPLRDFGMLTKYDHLKSWSLVDFLMSQGDEKWRGFMNEVKGYIDPKSKVAVAKEVPNLQRRGLRKIYRLNALSMDEKWKAWIMATYPAK